MPDRAFDGAALLVSVPAGGEHRGRSRPRWSRPAPRCARRPSSAATRPAIRCRRNEAAERLRLRMTATRPQPRPGVLDDRRLCAGQEHRARRRARCSSCRRTRRRSGRARRRSRPISAVAEHLEDYPGRRGDRAARGDRPRVRARSRPHRLRRRLRRSAQSAGATPISRDGDEAIHTTHGFLVYPIATLGSGATPSWSRRRRTTPPTSTRSSRAVTRAHQDRLPRQSRTIRPAPMCRSTRSSACTAACRRMCCWCSTPPMPNTSAATTTRPASSWSRPARTS